MRPITEDEKEKVKEIISEQKLVGDYEIHFGNIYFSKNSKLIPIELISKEDKKYYLVDLTESRILNKNNDF